MTSGRERGEFESSYGLLTSSLNNPLLAATFFLKNDVHFGYIGKGLFYHLLLNGFSVDRTFR